MGPSLSAEARAEAYARRTGQAVLGLLGLGKDGGVWIGTAGHAIKAHERPESYRAERNAYTRCRDVGPDEVNGFAVPSLVDVDDELLAIEMTVVSPPFVVDFASVVLDVDPELLEDEGHTLADLVRERFGDDRVGVVLDVRDELIARAGRTCRTCTRTTSSSAANTPAERGANGAAYRLVMDCAERPIADAVLTNLRGCAADARAVLGLAADAPPAAVVAAVDGFVHRWQRGDRPATVAADDVPYLMGSLWGEQLVAALGWAWAEVTFRRHADVPAAAVVSADRSLAVFPIHAVLAALADPDADVTIALAFDRLAAGTVDGFTPGGFANVMDVVHRDGGREARGS